MKTKKYPELYKARVTGQIQKWSIKVEMGNDGVSIIKCKHGIIDGKQIEENKPVHKGKNIGRSNETTPWEQAVSEAQSKWTKQKDKGYGEDPDNLEKPILPMLAKDYKTFKHRIVMPCYIQPKLNGVRCISSIKENETYMMSRGGKPILKFPNIRKELNVLLGDKRSREMYLDGEIYKPGMSLQKISGASRKEKDDVRKRIDSVMEYHVYDCFNPEEKDWPFKERNAFIKELLKSHKVKYVKYVQTVLVKNEKQALKKYEAWLKKGFEGMMFRNSISEYSIGHRSMDLQKHKPFVDDEFIIVGAHEGTGNDTGTVVWECVTKENRRFSVKPEGDRKSRKWYWKHRKEYIGKQLTVRYQELSDDGVPIFPVGVVIRDYE